MITDNERHNLLIRLEVLLNKLNTKSYKNLDKNTKELIDKLVGVYINTKHLTVKQRRAKLAQIISEELIAAYKKLSDDVIDDAIEVYNLTNTILAGSWAIKPLEHLEKMSSKTLLYGYELGDMIKSNKYDNIKAFKRVVADAVVNGLTAEEVSKNLIKANDKRLRHIDSVIIQSVMREARKNAQFEINKELEKQGIIKEYEWNATLEANTCQICASLDSKRFKTIDKIPNYPAHPRCRCAILEITGEEKDKRRAGRQYYIDEGELIKKGKQFKDITYDEWLKKQPKVIQDKVNSKKKLKLSEIKDLLLK